MPVVIRDVAHLEELLSEPSDAAIEAVRRANGDVLVLGVAGKMGPTLARMARRAMDAAGLSHRVIGVSRFSSPHQQQALEACGVETIRCDLLDESALARLPDAPSVDLHGRQKVRIHRKRTAHLGHERASPRASCARGTARSRIVAFSTGNVYGLTPCGRGGSREDDPPAPVGEYAMSCLGRERMFEYFSGACDIPVAILRLNYATEMRYGVLVDLARRVSRREPVDVTMGYFNTIWQGDANAMALAALDHAATPPLIVNIAGPEEVSVRGACHGARTDAGRRGHVHRPRSGGRAVEQRIARVGAPRHSTREPCAIAVVDRRLDPAGRRASGQAHTVRIPRGTILMRDIPASVLAALQNGRVIPAHPLALDADGRFDEQRQRALTRYYVAAGSGGLAVGVHTTQFAIRDPAVGLFERVLAIAADEMNRADARRAEPLIRIGGICGRTDQALREADLLVRLGYHAGLLSLAALSDAEDDVLIAHCEAVAARIPVVGFYLQPSVGGRPLSYAFWRRFAEIPAVIAIKIAPFNRYQTLDVLRAVVDAGRDDIALYTGNDDAIVADLVTPFRFTVDGRPIERRIVGGLLGHWAVWTQGAVRLLDDCHAAAACRSGAGRAPSARRGGDRCQRRLLRRGEWLRRMYRGNSGGAASAGARAERAVPGRPRRLSAGQASEIDRVCRAYPHLADDAFVRTHLDEWLQW